MSELTTLPNGYADLLEALKSRIGGAQVRAAVAVTRELVLLCATCFWNWDAVSPSWAARFQ